MNPSLKTLEKHWQPETAVQIRKLLEGKLDPETFESVQRWVQQCYNRPSHDELIMKASNEVLKGFGVEAVWAKSDLLEPAFEFVNIGDTYDVTLIYNLKTKNYCVTSYGNYIETLSKKGFTFA